MPAFPSAWRHPGDLGQLAALLARPVAWRGEPLIGFTRVLAGDLGDTVFSRASRAWLYGLALTEYADDAPRFDAAGMLVMEDQRTNQIRNPRMEGAAAGTSGTLPTNFSVIASTLGLSRTILGTGIEDGIPFLEMRLFGTPNTTSGYRLALEGSTAVAAAQGQTWTLTAFLRLTGGTIPAAGLPHLALQPRDAGAVPLGTAFTADAATPNGGSLALQRFALSAVLSQANTAALSSELRFPVQNGVPVDFTYRIGAPQLELGGFASSPVLPPAGTLSATTRAQDRARVSLAARGGIGFRFSVPALPQGTDQTIIFQADQGSESQDRIVVMLHASGALACYVIIGTDWNYIGLGNVVPGQLYAVALTVSDDGVRAKMAGGAEATWIGTPPPVNTGRIFNRADNFFARTGRFGPLDRWTVGATTDQILAALP